jgi:hypothetical protein
VARIIVDTVVFAAAAFVLGAATHGAVYLFGLGWGLF